MPNFRSILPAELSGNAIQRISKQWALASAQKPDGAVNTMSHQLGRSGIPLESAGGIPVCTPPAVYL